MGFWPISHAEELLGKSFLVLKVKEIVIVLTLDGFGSNVMTGVTATILLPC